MNSGSAEELVDLAVLTPCQPKRNHRDIKTCKARFSHSTISLLRFLSLTMHSVLREIKMFKKSHIVGIDVEIRLIFVRRSNKAF